ncbi:MAG: D-sedoheptulose-7-phosphate isomerase [Armatimonadota bacterium]
MMGFVNSYINGVINLLSRTPLGPINQLAELVLDAYENDKGVYIMGNGGSASTASHLACDLQKGIKLLSGKPFRVMALTDSVPLMTAWANDFSYADIFAQPLNTWVQPKDLVIAISGSGKSTNVIKAVEVAHNKGAVTAALVGFDGGELGKQAMYRVIIPSEDMQQIEDVHMVVAHLIMRYIAFHLENGKASSLIDSVMSDVRPRRPHNRRVQMVNHGSSKYINQP